MSTVHESILCMFWCCHVQTLVYGQHQNSFTTKIQSMPPVTTPYDQINVYEGNADPHWCRSGDQKSYHNGEMSAVDYKQYLSIVCKHRDMTLSQRLVNHVDRVHELNSTTAQSAKPLYQETYLSIASHHPCWNSCTYSNKHILVFHTQ